ncbi:MAG: diaminopimelate epimerase [Actinobacteria bacterium]|nr:diaminopimelate epimerase [Actinomycetota bacterium]
MQGLGNDFVLVEGPMSFDSGQIAALCDRRFGVGADGVLVVSRNGGFRMEYWNADGSAAEMCGNGLRCVAKYVYDRGWAPDRAFSVLTADGERGVRVLDDGSVIAELGRPRLGEEKTLERHNYRLVDMGNPHAVRIVENPAGIDVEGVGRALQAEFPNGSNVEFISVDEAGISMRVWERGVGETLACGTGMAAAAAVANQHLGVKTPIQVTVPGGTGTVELRDGVAWLKGPAEVSFSGTVGER